MLWGGCANTPKELEDLRDLNLDFAEIILSSSSSRRAWWESGIKSGTQEFFLVGHGPITDSADDLRSLWDHYFPALKSTLDAAERLGIKLLTIHMDISRCASTFPRHEKMDGIYELLRQEKLRAIAVRLNSFDICREDAEYGLVDFSSSCILHPLRAVSE